MKFGQRRGEQPAFVIAGRRPQFLELIDHDHETVIGGERINGCCQPARSPQEVRGEVAGLIHGRQISQRCGEGVERVRAGREPTDEESAPLQFGHEPGEDERTLARAGWSHDGREALLGHQLVEFADELVPAEEVRRVRLPERAEPLERVDDGAAHRECRRAEPFARPPVGRYLRR